MRRAASAIVVGLALLVAVPLYATRERDGPSVASFPVDSVATAVAIAAPVEDDSRMGADVAAGPAPESAVDATAALADHASAALYDRTCSACHGAVGGEGYTIGPRIISRAYVASRADTAMARLIRDGVSGTSMMGFGPGRGDLLTDDQVAALVRWLRAQGARAP